MLCMQICACFSTINPLGLLLKSSAHTGLTQVHLTINMIQLLPNFILSCFKSSTNHRSIFPSIKDSTTDEIEEQWYMSTLNNPTPFF